MNRNSSSGPPKTNVNTPMKNMQAPTSSPTVSSTLLNNPMVATNESIKLIAESIGVSNLNEEATRELASDLSFIVKSILVDAQKFARRSRRKKIVPSDIDYSLKARSLEPIYGFTSTDQVPFRCATSTGGNGSGRSLFYSDEQIVDLIDLISINNQSVKIPNDFAIHAHWLAIEGVQPSVPENPQLITREMQKREAVEGSSNKPKETQKQQQTQQKRQENLVKLKTLVPHDLSVEQQIYFKEVTEACVGSDEHKRTEALNSLSTDPGLHQLLPRIILFISEGVRLNIIQQNMAILIWLMRMAKSLSENKSIYLEKYLHELLPSIFSCVLSKQVCARPEVDNHCVLREFGARLIGQIVKTYKPTIPTLQTRAIKVYLNSLQSEQTTFATLFGAITGLTELGNDISESFIFPLVKKIGERIVAILDSPANQQEKLLADKIKQQLIRAIMPILKTKQISNEYEYSLNEFGAYFGPLIHTQLMKIRSQQQNVVQGQVVSHANQRTVLIPPLNRAQASNVNQQSSQSMERQRPASSTFQASIISSNVPNQNQNQENLNDVEIMTTSNQSAGPTNETKSDHIHMVVQTGSETKSIDINATSQINFNSNGESNLNQKDPNFENKAITSGSGINENGSQYMDLNATPTNGDFPKVDTDLMNMDQTDNIEATLQTELLTTNTDLHIENNQNNMSSLTSDSNNTNNMTTSDVNLSDTVENNLEHLAP